MNVPNTQPYTAYTSVIRINVMFCLCIILYKKIATHFLIPTECIMKAPLLH